MSYQNQTYVENEGTYYYVSPTTENYTTAQSICRNNFQSKLAVLNTQQLFDKAKSLSGTGTFYIGLHKPNMAATYQWLDGSAFNRSLINGRSIVGETLPGCRGVVMQILGQSNPVNLLSYGCSSTQNLLCFTPTQPTTTPEATTSPTLGSTTSYDTTTTTLSPTTNTVLTKVQPTTQLYNSTQTTTTGLTNTQSANAGGLQLGVVVGIPLGVVLLLILLIALIVWLKRRGGDKSNEADASLETNERQVSAKATYDVVSNDCDVRIDNGYETILPVDERGYIDLGDVTRNAGERGATRQIMTNTGPAYCTIDPPRRADTNNPYLVPLPAP
ncbi:uncharacterized protein LOC144744307 [Ciona intestinalis]